MITRHPRWDRKERTVITLHLVYVCRSCAGNCYPDHGGIRRCIDCGGTDAEQVMEGAELEAFRAKIKLDNERMKQ